MAQLPRKPSSIEARCAAIHELYITNKPFTARTLLRKLQADAIMMSAQLNAGAGKQQVNTRMEDYITQLEHQVIDLENQLLEAGATPYTFNFEEKQ